MYSNTLNLFSGESLHKILQNERNIRESVYSRLADKTRRTQVKGRLAVSRLSRGVGAICLLIYGSLPIKEFFNTQAPSVTS